MIEQEPQLLPELGRSRHDEGGYPDDQSEHAREAGVADDDEEAPEQHGQDGPLEGDHGIGRDRVSKVLEHGCRRKDAPMKFHRCGQIEAGPPSSTALGARVRGAGRKDSPPAPGLAVPVHHGPVLVRPDYPGKQAHDAQQVEEGDVAHEDTGQGLQRPILDAAELLALVLGEIDKGRVPSDRGRPAEIGHRIPTSRLAKAQGRGDPGRCQGDAPAHRRRRQGRSSAEPETQHVAAVGRLRTGRSGLVDGDVALRRAAVQVRLDHIEALADGLGGGGALSGQLCPFFALRQLLGLLAAIELPRPGDAQRALVLRVTLVLEQRDVMLGG